MSSEATVSIALGIRKGNLQYAQPGPTSKRVDVDTTIPKGPTPGSVSISTAGQDITFGELTTGGGLCYILNKDPTNFVRYGAKSGATTLLPFKLLPGESAVVRLDDLLQAGSGTAFTSTLHIKADTAPCDVVIDAFDE